MDLTAVSRLKAQPKPIRLVQEKVPLATGGTLEPLPVETPKDALRATLLMLFKHVADVHVTIVEILAEKYNLKVDEIHDAITSDPRWTEMLTNPVISDLTASVKEHTAPPPKPPKRKIQISTEEELVFD